MRTSHISSTTLRALHSYEPEPFMKIIGALLILAGGCGHGRSPADAPPDAALSVRRGAIDVIERGTVDLERTIFAAEFRELTNVTITQRDEGRCRVEHLTFDASVDVSAGALTFADEGSSVAIVLQPDGENRYHGASVEGLRYDVNELVTTSAEGETVPAFSSAFGFPDRLHVTEPVLAPDERLTFTSSGLEAVWNPSGGAVFFKLQQLLPNAQITIECPFVGSEERGSIPPGVRADLVADATGSATTLRVETFNGTRPIAGDFDIAIDAAFVGLRARVVVP